MLKIVIMTFFIVFIAELGDKTQLQVMLLATQSKSIWPVFIGSSLALIFSSLIAVLAADYICKIINPSILQTAAGIIFIIFGVLTLFGKL
ncbi:TMEM165/GDT1 family protein [Alkaliphilus serpentinus]|uniref:GDT1 family protein n=1 Tax=Alkaliphilus serpentinus TaxID=1482731 RepID=A0A833MEY6_9FIRM|nr:TMEM165/GDT1 family protein [Alkaliphilus serpentinus]KAB3532212.1 TMEM165/GDT1 family protein [Alkaliphilus serpentinus]